MDAGARFELASIGHEPIKEPLLHPALFMYPEKYILYEPSLYLYYLQAYSVIEKISLSFGT